MTIIEAYIQQPEGRDQQPEPAIAAEPAADDPGTALGTVESFE